MNRQVLITLLLAINFPVFSQNAIPGGVKDLCIWNTTKDNGSNAILKSNKNNLQDTLPVINGAFHNINNNPAIYLNSNTLETSLNLSSIPAYTLFTICQPVDTARENIIFYTENDSGIETVLTDRRLASIKSFKYANFDSRAKSFPRIYSYCQFNNKDSVQLSGKLKLGQKPRKQNLPVQALRGYIPEILIYSRNITYREKLKVESYLSLKYGIPLSQTLPTHYLNSKGDTIWDADINSTYSTHIAGIGRDDVSGLNQKISECIEDPGMMKIAAINTIKNNSFLIWGDNRGSASFGEFHNIPKCLEKEWRLNAFKAAGSKVNVFINSLSLEEIKPLNEGEFYWLMIDKTGTGSYPFGETKFLKCQKMASTYDTVMFANVLADQDSSGADVFSLIAMPELFMRCVVENPNCNANGKLKIEIVGGQPPYNLTLAGDYSYTLNTTDTLAEIPNVVQGGYSLQLRDSKNQTYKQAIWVSNTSASECRIKQHYKINKGSSIILDASQGMPKNYTFTWTTPDNEVINNAKATIYQEGKYYLEISDKQGCSSVLEINVTEIKPANIDAVEIFPNPTKGNFSLRVELSNDAAVELFIADISGKVISNTVLKGQKYYWYNGVIPKPGIYTITLKTLSDQRTVKLIVN